MEEPAGRLLRLIAGLASAPSLVIAGVLGALCGFALRVVLLTLVERRHITAERRVRAWFFFVSRFCLGTGWVLLAVGYAVLTAAMLRWDRDAALVAAGVAALLLLGPLVWNVVLRRPRRFSIVGLLARTTLILAVLLLATLSLLRSGFLALTTDRPLLQLELTGETRPQTVRWMAPDQPLQEQALRTHRILLRTPSTDGKGGELVGETWLYGDQVAIKGRVLRLAPILNVAGIANLFALESVHNGYFTPERHNQLPHHAEALRPLGPLTVHPRFLPLRNWLLSRWEQASHDAAPESRWAIRAATTESTYFALVDAAGQPLRRTYTLVLTPGGLSSR